MKRACIPTISSRSPISRAFRLQRKKICATAIRSACSPCRRNASRIHASSGTTGKPTVVGYTAQDIDNWSNRVARSIRAAGARRGDKVHVSYGYGLFTDGLRTMAQNARG